jgi:hypothetical protein
VSLVVVLLGDMIVIVGGVVSTVKYLIDVFRFPTLSFT